MFFFFKKIYWYKSLEQHSISYFVSLKINWPIGSYYFNFFKKQMGWDSTIKRFPIKTVKVWEQKVINHARWGGESVCHYRTVYQNSTVTCLRPACSVGCGGYEFTWFFWYHHLCKTLVQFPFKSIWIACSEPTTQSNHSIRHWFPREKPSTNQIIGCLCPLFMNQSEQADRCRSPTTTTLIDTHAEKRVAKRGGSVLSFP